MKSLFFLWEVHLLKEAASAPGDHQGTSPTPEEMKTIKETLTSAFIEKYGTTHADRKCSQHVKYTSHMVIIAQQWYIPQTGNNVKQRLDDGDVWTNLWKRIKFHGLLRLMCWWNNSSSVSKESTISVPSQWRAWISCTCLKRTILHIFILKYLILWLSRKWKVFNPKDQWKHFLVVQH